MLYGFVLLTTWHSPSSHIHGHNLGANSPNMHTRSTTPPPATTATRIHCGEDKVIATSPPLYFIHFFAGHQLKKKKKTHTARFSIELQSLCVLEWTGWWAGWTDREAATSAGSRYPDAPDATAFAPVFWLLKAGWNQNTRWRRKEASERHIWSFLRVIMDEADIKEKGFGERKKELEPGDVMTIKETGRVIPWSGNWSLGLHH